MADETWNEVSAEAQADFLRLGEETVRSTLALGHGADFRAVTMMGIFGTLGVGLFAAVAALLASAHPFWAAIAAGTVAGIGFFVAAFFAALAAWPGEFFVSGFEPRAIIESSAAKDQYRNRVLIATIQDQIDYNRRAIDRGAKRAMWAMGVGGISVFLAVLTLLVVGLAFRPDEKVPVPVSGEGQRPAAAAPAAAAGWAGAEVHRP